MSFDRVAAEWYISERGEEGSTITRRKVTVTKNYGNDVIIFKDDKQILRLPIEQWEELKRVI